jgi:GGDEF domain-containing protein
VSELGIVARPGGGEFVLVSTELSNSDQISTILERSLQIVEKPFEIGHREFVLACRLGVCLYPYDALDSDSLLK